MKHGLQDGDGTQITVIKEEKKVISRNFSDLFIKNVFLYFSELRCEMYSQNNAHGESEFFIFPQCDVLMCKIVESKVENFSCFCKVRCRIGQKKRIPTK